MKSSTTLSIGLTAAVAAWMLSGAVASVPEPESSGAAAPRPVDPMRVAVVEVDAEYITREIVIQGELEPLRQVEVSAGTASRIAALPVAKGARVEAGEVLVRLDREDRAAQLKRAEAEVGSQRFELSGIRKLEKQGLQAEHRLRSAEAALALAEAARQRARLELSFADIEAPFAGVLEQRYAELGAHLEIGERVALLVDDSVLKAVGQVSQQSAGRLALGQTVAVRLLDGRVAEGSVTYVSRVGDAQTHSFRIEAEIPNADGTLSAGVSAELRIAIGSEAAHFLSPAVLALDEVGAVGVKVVGDDGRVAFYQTTLVRTEADGIWVSGLPATARVISQGQGFVTAGESVVAVPQARTGTGAGTRPAS